MTGSGTAGAYHAGVLRAVHEAGMKIDLIAGCSIGVVGALFSAVDGAAWLWDASGPWRSADGKRLYRWRATVRVATRILAAVFFLLVVPLVILVAGAVVYPASFLLRLLGIEVGTSITSVYGQLLNTIFSPVLLPTFLPRIIVVVLVVLLGTLAVGVVASSRRTRSRRTRGTLWWQLLGAPLDMSRVAEKFTNGLRQLIGGGTPLVRLSLEDLGRSYSDLLTENLGQPGFKELIVTAHDLDAKRDLVFALLADSSGREFFMARTSRQNGQRSLETFNLSGVAREHVIDVLAGALSVPVLTEPHLVNFASDSQWRGEAHRLRGRPEAIARLLEEVANAGVEQVIVVSASADLSGPHALTATRRDVRGLVGENLAAAEATAVRDAISAKGHQFQALFEIRPGHNPLGPLDFRGCYDERSDRHQSLSELVNRGYEDAYRRFVDPVVGAGGERIEQSQSDSDF